MLTLLLRMAILGVSILWGYLLSDKKKIYWIFAAVISAVFVGHFIACLQVGYADPIGDISNYVRVAQMPILVLVFTSCLKQNEKSLRGMVAGGAGALLIVLGVELLSLVSGTNPGTYTDGTGILGWFFNTNSQSAIISSLVPILLCWILCNRQENLRLFSFAAFFGCGALYCLGTRLAYASLFAVTIGLAICLLIINFKRWKNALVLLCVAIIFLTLYPWSPMVVHQGNYNTVQQDRQEESTEILENEAPSALPESSDPSQGPSEESPEMLDKQEETDLPLDKAMLVQRLQPIYEKYLAEFVDIFGLEETMEMYDYTSNPYEFSNLRKRKIIVAEHLLDTSPILSRFFGVELSRFTINGTIYDVENDFHGILYLYGWFGFGCYVLFIGYFLCLIVYALCKDFKKYVTVEAVAFGFCMLLCLIHAYFTAGVLRRPNASVYLSMALAAIYYLVCIKKYERE